MNSAIAIRSDPDYTENHAGAKTPFMAGCILGGLLLLYAAVRVVRRHHRDHPQHRRHY